jgi:DNA polymerase (family 10)
MDNRSIAQLLAETADLLEIGAGDPFRIRSYRRAAEAVESSTVQLSSIAGDPKKLQEIPGIGKGMAANIVAIEGTGTLPLREELLAKYRPTMLELLRLPGMGPKTVALLWDALQVSSVQELETAITAGRLAGLPRFGEKLIEKLRKGIEDYKQRSGRFLIDDAETAAEKLIAYLREFPGFTTIMPAGSLRRGRDTVGDLDILATGPCCSEDQVAAAVEYAANYPPAATMLAKGQNKVSFRLRSGLQVDVRLLPERSFGAALQYFTGSKAHNVKIRQIAIKKGFKLSEWGLFASETGKTIAARTEEDVYEALGLPWIPPTLREDTGEVEAALKGELPSVVTEKDIRGDLHTHTNLTDGLAPMEEMVAAAAARGLEYYAITDHAENLFMTGMSREKVLDQRAKIDKLQKKYPKMKLLHGCELNIGKDGTLDYDPEFLLTFDVAVASVHSYFRLSREETTARVIKAMESPAVTVIGHPSGRMIGRRQPIDFDFEAVCAAAVRTGTALEVNCFPDRLDLRDEHVRWAIERGVTISIDTDSHAPKHLENLRFGVGTAQRGWAAKNDVLTTRTVKQVLAFAQKKRAKA